MTTIPQFARPSTLLLAAVLAGCSSPAPRADVADTVQTSASGSRAITPTDTSPTTAETTAPTTVDTAPSGSAIEPAKAPAAPAKVRRPKLPPAEPVPDSAGPPVAKQDTTARAPATDSAAPTASHQDQWVSFDAATNTVTFKLVAGPFSFDGFTGGGATLTVPAGSTVVINFIQDDGTPHSAEVASGEGPVPGSGGDPAIPRAYTNKVVEGMVQGGKDTMRFTAPASGTFRLICGVPGHALSGMWIWLKVDPAAKTPSFGPTKQ
jgi:hypothetical protein